MTKFKKHEGKLFRMLDDPVPLAPDSKLPCLVQLIQDDSPMGRNNKNCFTSYLEQKFIGCLEQKYVIKELVGGKKVAIEKGLVSAHNSRFEIIGTFVEEGSKDWAVWQMMNGEKVFRVEWECDMYCQYTNNEIITFRYGISSTISPVEEWIANAKRADFGWQIYKEPELKYKVGDWVEVESSHTKGKTFVSVIKEMPNQKHYTVHVNSSFGGYTVYGVMERQIVRKLKPSEVRIRIGCLEGTVEAVSNKGIHLWFHLVRDDGHLIATIRISNLDPHTRELVESLLKAQEEEK